MRTCLPIAAASAPPNALETVTLFGEAPTCWPARCACAPLACALPVWPSFFFSTLARELTVTWLGLGLGLGLGVGLGLGLGLGLGHTRQGADGHLVRRSKVRVGSRLGMRATVRVR